MRLAVDSEPLVVHPTTADHRWFHMRSRRSPLRHVGASHGAAESERQVLSNMDFVLLLYKHTVYATKFRLSKETWLSMAELGSGMCGSLGLLVGAGVAGGARRDP
ncbi:MAG: hypothetical protein ACTHU0_18690 [Kofleriaceae bacterium]